MKTATLDVGGMLSLLDYQSVERRFGQTPGVQRAMASIASRSVTVEYDEAVTSVARLRDEINECGFHCTGQIWPRHICEPHPGHVDEHGMQVDHGVPRNHLNAGAPTDHPAPEHHAAHAPAGARTSHDMAHDMGHGGVMDMHAMMRDMRNRFWISLAFTVPIFIYSPMGDMFTPPAPPFGLSLHLWLFFFASAAILYPGWPFVIAAIRALQNGILNMAVLVLLSVGTGYLFSVGATFFFKGDQFYEAAAMLLVFVLLGHWLEMRAQVGASQAIRALLDLAPPVATVLRDGREVEIPTAEVLAGETVVIRPGNKISVDGTVTQGSSQVDESMLTGESVPVGKKPGDTVIGGTINKSGTFRYTATKVGADTALAQIVKLVQEAQNSKAPGQLLADRAAQWLVLSAIVVGLLTFAVWFWWIGQSLLFAMTLMITIFIIACPDALVLATPMAVMVGTDLGAVNGILFKNAAALEDATKLDAIIFDKTGTLTVGQPEVVDVVAASHVTTDAVLATGAAVERGSEHPLGQAIVRRAQRLAVPTPKGFENIEGMGVRAEIDGEAIFLGNRRLMDTQKFDLGALAADAQRLEGAGRTVVHVARAGKLIGLIAIADAPRPTAAATVAKLRERGVQVAMLTGDNAGTAQRIARELGIDIVLADVLPGQKAGKVKELQAQGKKVGMVGDVVGAVELSSATLRKMHQNL